MNNRLSLLLLLRLLAPLVAEPAKSSSTIRGSETQDEGSNLHRHLLKKSSCLVLRKNIRYEPTEDHPNGYEEESWACELSEEDTARLNVHFVDIVEPSSFAKIANVVSGESVLTLSEVIIDTHKSRMYIPEDASVEVRNDDKNKRRHLAKTTGNLDTLVIRLSDKKNVCPDASVAEIEMSVFGKDVSLKERMESCSYGKLNIEPYQGKTSTNLNIENGIVNVQMDFDCASGGNGFVDAAFNAADEQIGSLWAYDLVMFVVPPVQGIKVAAFSYTNCRYSFFINNWYGSVSTQMEEIGSNLGLGSSYGKSWHDKDETGFMGSSKTFEEKQMCFNPQKNYQLGWYSDKTKSIDPLDGMGPYNIALNGVCDYEKNNDASVAVRLDQTSKVEDYYVGFNRAEGINADTLEDRNMVTIMRKEVGCGASEYGKSYKVASLEPGQEHVIANFNDQADVTVRFVELEDGDATIQITSGDDEMPSTCEDMMAEDMKFKWKKGKGRKKACRQWAKKKKCNKKIQFGDYKGKSVWEVCQKSCMECDEM